MPISRLAIGSSKIKSAAEKFTITRPTRPELTRFSSHRLKSELCVIVQEPILGDYYGCDENTVYLKVEINFSEYIALGSESFESENDRMKFFGEDSYIHTIYKAYNLSDDALEMNFTFFVNLLPERYKNLRNAFIHDRVSSITIQLEFDPVSWFDEIDESTAFIVEHFEIIDKFIE